MKPSTYLSPDFIADVMTRGVTRGARTWLKNVTVQRSMSEKTPWYTCPQFWMNPFSIEYVLPDGKSRVLDLSSFSDGLASALINNPMLISALEEGKVTDVQAEILAKHVFSFKRAQ